jgi:pyruvate dehydrogenase E2 component (dihydrolipoamide acetyltransferase)
MPGLVERRAAGLRAYVGGAGPAVVLLHGLAGAAVNWVDVAPSLAADHRVVALDLPGHGASSPAPRRGGIEAFADAVSAALEQLDAVPAVVAGHSFGAQVGLRLAARRPELLRGLVLVSPSGIETRRRAARAVVLGSVVVRPGARVAPLARRLGGRAWFRRLVFRPWYVSDADALSERMTQAFFAQLRAHTGLRAAAAAMLDDDPRPGLHEVSCPTLLLWGARDAQVPLRDGFEYARRLRAPIRVVADCGHLVIGERPGAVLDAVRAVERAA